MRNFVCIRRICVKFSYTFAWRNKERTGEGSRHASFVYQRFPMSPSEKAQIKILLLSRLDGISGNG